MGDVVAVGNDQQLHRAADLAGDDPEAKKIVAGLIEGFVSTSELGWAGRAAASGVSLLFLAAYLAAGALHELRGRRAY